MGSITDKQATLTKAPPRARAGATASANSPKAARPVSQRSQHTAEIEPPRTNPQEAHPPAIEKSPYWSAYQSRAPMIPPTTPARYARLLESGREERPSQIHIPATRAGIRKTVKTYGSITGGFHPFQNSGMSARGPLRFRGSGNRPGQVSLLTGIAYDLLRLSGI